MSRRAHAEIPFPRPVMIKILQRFLSTPKPSANHLEPARHCVGVNRPFCSSACWGRVRHLPHLAFVPSHFPSVSNTRSRDPPPVHSPHRLRRPFDFTVLALEASAVEIMGATGAGSRPVTKTPPTVSWQPLAPAKQGNSTSLAAQGRAGERLFATGNGEAAAMLRLAGKSHVALLAFGLRHCKGAERSR